jgi:hypothetical protein
MKTVSSEDRKRIEEGLRQKYVLVAISPEGNFQYPTGKDGLKGQDYNPAILNSLPDDVLSSYCGVETPSASTNQRGETIRCHAGGVDSLIAATMVGPNGKVNRSHPEMVERPRKIYN